MANRQDEDDLFKHTSMTFGEHLEELRASLFKAVLSLASRVLHRAVLRAHDRAVDSIAAGKRADDVLLDRSDRVHQRARAGQNCATTRRCDKLVFEEGMVPQETYIAPADLLRELKQKYPGKFDRSS